MALAPGSRLGPYEIVAPIGAGGMGEVYKARDTRLDRAVAIKVLTAQFVDDLSLRERFEREARTVASLSHPHICAIYDVGAGPPVFLVMEYLEGETLEARLQRGPLPLDQALRHAIDIADALDKAHRAGIVHRDLKPGNVMLTRSGAKLLDFGLAKAAAARGIGGSALSMLPTTPPALTAAGAILGTFQYMSPEQLEGAEADARSDIFAFGTLVYEAVTGRRAFQGKSQASLIGAIMTAEPPDLTSAQPLAPPRLDRIIRKCLAKDPDERWQTAKDLKDELTWVSLESSQPATVAVPVIAKAPRARHREIAAWVIAGVALAALAAAAVLARRGSFQSADTPPMYRSSILLPEGINPSTAVSSSGRMALSPDGKRLVISATSGQLGSAQRQLWMRQLNGTAAQIIPGTEGGAAPFWSPDSNVIAFTAQGKLKKISASGGPAVTLADAAVTYRGAWNRDDVILFTPKNGALQRISASGGAITPVTTIDAAGGDVIHSDPVFLPDGRHFLFQSTGFAAGGRPAGVIRIGSLDPKEPARPLTPTDSSAAYALGYVLFVRDRALMAQRFDTDRLELRGQPQLLVDQVDTSTTTPVSGGAFSVSDTGVLAYRTGLADIRSELAWFDRTGRRLSVVGEPADQINVELSPDGTRAVLSLLDSTKASRDLWIYDLVRGLRTRFSFDPSDEINAVWSPDGSQIVFNSRRAGRLDLYQKAANGTGDDMLLLSDMQNNLYPSSWSRDGKYLLYFSGNATARTGNDLWLLPMPAVADKDAKATARHGTPFVQTPFNETVGVISPDGRWAAYTSGESGRNEIYVTSFPAASGKWQVSSGGGAFPRWRRDGRELYFVSPANLKLMVADVNGPSNSFNVGTVTALFDSQMRTIGFAGTNPPNYDVTGDGQKFLVNVAEESAATVPITLVVNWTSELKK